MQLWWDHRRDYYYYYFLLNYKWIAEITYLAYGRAAGLLSQISAQYTSSIYPTLCHMIQHSHCWAYAQIKLQFEKIAADSSAVSTAKACNSLNARRQMNGWRRVPCSGGIPLSHQKGWNNAICGNMGGPRDYHIGLAKKFIWVFLEVPKSSKWTFGQPSTKRSQSDRERQISYDITDTWI